MDRETNDLIARLYLRDKNLSEVEPLEFARWASLELERGRDTQSLRRLIFEGAGGSDASEAERLFRESLVELGWEVPGKKAAMKLHAESIMQSIVTGDIEPYDGCSHLYIISIFLKHPDYLYNWNGLFWAREDLAAEELNGLIRGEASRALAGEVTPISLPRHEDEDEESPHFLDRLRGLVRRG